MVNSLIPYTFIPGAKAKAQEVNENFIALADEIQNNKSSNVSKFDEIDNRFETSENKISKCISLESITNCIIKCTDDIATYENNNITIKSGISVLISNGKTSDGNFINKEYTLAEDVVITENWDGIYTVFLKDDGSIVYVLSANVLKGYSTPEETQTYNSVFYNIQENKWYYASTGNTFSESNIVPILDFTGTSGTISDFRTYKVLNILKESDSANISKYGYPSHKYIPIVIGASGTNYTAPASGYFNVMFETPYLPGQFTYLVIASPSGFTETSVAPASGAGGYVCVTCPCKKNDSVGVGYLNTGNVIHARFYYAEGEVE